MMWRWLRMSGRASEMRSRTVSTPPVRSVHPMDPRGAWVSGWFVRTSPFVDGVRVGREPER